MAIDDTTGFIITVRTTVTGEVCENVLKYFNMTAAPQQSTPTQAMTDWVTDIIPLWLDCLSVDATIINVTVDPTIPVGQGYTNYPPLTSAVNLPGTVTGEALPPYVSARLYKVPAIAEQDPVSPIVDWRNGMVRIAGLSESAQNGGVLTGAALTYLTALADALDIIQLGPTNHRLYWRRLVGADYFYMPASGVQPGSVLGSQNTRKIGY